MRVLPTRIPDVLVLEPQVFGDDRGFFMETWQAARFAEVGLPVNFVQDNHSRSKRGTLRGLHYQLAHPQGKLVRCAAGSVFDVAVDLRRSSSTFGKWVGEVLSDENQRQMWVPSGFAHGFLVLSESADFLYKCTDYYDPASERCLLWDDPAVGIEWPVLPDAQILLSAKDRAGKTLANTETYP